jgi:hypothetical protein
MPYLGNLALLGSILAIQYLHTFLLPYYILYHSSRALPLGNQQYLVSYQQLSTLPQHNPACLKKGGDTFEEYTPCIHAEE